MTKNLENRILVIEDDEMTAEVIVDTLVQGGYSVKWAREPIEGLKLIEEWCPRLVITDHDMPSMSGLDLLCQLRQKENYVTVIFVSGRKDTKIIVKALKEGADDFIEKPFRVDELLARVQVSLRNNDIHRELKSKNEKLETMVDIDDLTGLFNMRSIYDRIDAELARAVRQDHKVAVLMMDMDHFKTVNDTNDHLFGSFVLKEVGSLVKANIREYDFAARYGGDEFLICLNEIEPDEAEKFCERLRLSISKYIFSDGSNSMNLTCSIGMAIASPSAEKDARNLVREADHALYEAKDAGRDQSVVHELKIKSDKLTAS